MGADPDIWVDLNSEDDTGLPWTYLHEARQPSKIVPGSYVVAGSSAALAVARVVDVGEDGLVHLEPLPGPVGTHAHLLRTSA
ncbi:MAG: hypothetical protein ACRDZQ_13385 [Acidimicrobiales bacterium]